MSSGTTTLSTSDGSGEIRYFSGESEDYKEYRRWKLWLSSKFKTLDKLQADARGPYVFTCLSGKALETVEHVDPAEYQQDGGEQVLLRLLDARFPERDQTDELAEVLNEVFSMRATENKILRAWVSRATDLFDRCERKGGVKFPEEARGFVLVKWSGLTEEQQAVVKGHECSSEKRSARRCEVAIRISLSAVARRLLWWMMKILGLYRPYPATNQKWVASTMWSYSLRTMRSPFLLMNLNFSLSKK